MVQATLINTPITVIAVHPEWQAIIPAGFVDNRRAPNLDGALATAFNLQVILLISINTDPILKYKIASFNEAPTLHIGNHTKLCLRQHLRHVCLLAYQQAHL